MEKLRGVVHTLVGAVVVSVGAVFLINMSRSSVHGSMTSEGGELGQWTLDDSGWDVCQSGENRGFFGVELFDKATKYARLILVDDAATGRTLKFGIPGTDEALRVPEQNCIKVDVDVHRENSRINRIWNVAGHVDFDCHVNGSRVHGSVTFAHCH